jgi:hypothetical protein
MEENIMDDKMKNFIQKLKEKTQNKQILWKERSFNTMDYRFRFNSGLVELSNFYDGYNDENYITLSITNNDGRVVYTYDRHEYLQDTEQQEQLIIKELYETVHKQIYNTEEVIDGILEEIDMSSKVISSQSVEENDNGYNEDEIPF